ncbi:MAG: signal peptide peptidase SppA [Myxococcales bacterium]|nr:signal peptide peptidase SppA [Myxococcales bacterium]
MPTADQDPPTNPSSPPPLSAPIRKRPRAARLILGIALVGALTLAGGVAGAVILLKGDYSPSVKDGSYLEVVVDAKLQDAPGATGFVLDPNDFPVLLTEATADIRRAAGDARITGLYLEVEGTSLGWAGAGELRAAIVEFGASGKPCHAWADAYDNKAYYIASACKDVYVSPAGVMLVNGFSLTTEYYAGTMEKLGVTSNFEHVGDFKSAIEPYQRTEPSEAASVAMDYMLDGLYEELVNGVAAGRGVPVETVRGWIDDPPITPESAVTRGMITGARYRDQVADELGGKERTELSDYHEDPSGFGGGKTVAVVHADGAIVSGESGSPMFGGSMVGDRTLVEIFDDLREDEAVAAVVLRVNSPGGSGLASDNIWRALIRLKEAGKPLVVSMGDYAASGGYYIAAPADWIVAQPGTLTGSIGVFGGKLNLGGIYGKLGITTHTWRRGAMSDLFSPISDFNDGERAKFREFLQGFYDIFLVRVGEGRKLGRDAVHEVAQGRVWTGLQAKDRGLVDEIGGLDAALLKARELAAVPQGEELRIERYPRRRTFIEQLSEDLQKARLPAEATLPEVKRAWAQLEVLERVLADGGVAAMLPAAIDVR